MKYKTVEELIEHDAPNAQPTRLTQQSMIELNMGLPVIIDDETIIVPPKTGSTTIVLEEGELIELQTHFLERFKSGGIMSDNLYRKIFIKPSKIKER